MATTTTERDDGPSPAASDHPQTRSVSVAGRTLVVTPVFDTYWRFAAARQAVYEARLAGLPQPWSTDPILTQHRFTNCFRAADRVSQFLIRHVSYAGPQAWEDVFFRILLFKMFNKISTWQLLKDALGEISWETYNFEVFDRVLSRAFDSGERLYSAAYIVPAPPFGESRKHRNHLRLLETMMTTGAPERVLEASDMSEAFDVLLSYPGIGRFLAYQYLIDLNYAAPMAFSEMEFVVPGPGAKDGIRKCFGMAADQVEAEVIRYMADTQKEHFSRLGLNFPGLRGRRLQLIDCQNLFCEVDKYARVAHPDISGVSGRKRIKQIFHRDPSPLTAWFPPKWGINDLPTPPPQATGKISGMGRPGAHPRSVWPTAEKSGGSMAHSRGK